MSRGGGTLEGMDYIPVEDGTVEGLQSRGVGIVEGWYSRGCGTA